MRIALYLLCLVLQGIVLLLADSAGFGALLILDICASLVIGHRFPRWQFLLALGYNFGSGMLCLGIRMLSPPGSAYGPHSLRDWAELTCVMLFVSTVLALPSLATAAWRRRKNSAT